MRVIWALPVLFLISISAHAQDVIGLSVPFNQFTRNYFLMNPASIGNESNLEINLGRQFNTDEWSNIYTHYANINLELTPKRKAANYSHHTGGLSLIGDREGEYLSRSRMYALYNLHIMLSGKTSLAAGAAVGFASYAVTGTAISASGSATALDGSIGLWLYDASGGHVGLSINQFPNRTLTPIVETTQLLRHYHLSLRKAIQLNAHLSLYPAMLVRYVPRYPASVGGNASLVMHDLFSVGAAMQYQKNFSLMAGLEKIPVWHGYVKAAFSYSQPASNQALANFNSYELTVSFFLKKPEKAEEVIEEEK